MYLGANEKGVDMVYFFFIITTINKSLPMV